MKFLNFLLRLFVSMSVSTAIWLILFFAYDQQFGLSTLYALGGGAIIFGGLTLYSHFAFLKKNQLTRNEYVYIRKNMREARGKIKRIRKTFLNVRSLRTFRQTLTINRLVSRIYTIVRREPKRFFLAERFFFYHLDSMVELTEKHSFLAAQSVQDKKMQLSLKETRFMLDQLIKTVEKDLTNILSKDMDHLKFELDVAKHSLTTWVHPLSERSPKNEGTQ